jgi:hypothetical protein
MSSRVSLVSITPLFSIGTLSASLAEHDDGPLVVVMEQSVADNLDEVECLVACEASSVCKPSERGPGRCEPFLLLENRSKDIALSMASINNVATYGFIASCHGFETRCHIIVLAPRNIFGGDTLIRSTTFSLSPNIPNYTKRFANPSPAW